MSKVKDNIHFLRFIASASTVKQRQSVLRTASKEQVFAIAEVVANLLEGNIPISDAALKVIRIYRKHLRRLGTNERNKLSWIKRKESAVKASKAIAILLKEFGYIWGPEL